MIFDFHGERFAVGIETRPFRNSPTDQDAVYLKAEIVVEISGVMPLDAEEAATVTGFLRRDDGTGFGSGAEVPLLFIFLEAHSGS
jgi:hypothetical protein